MNAETVRPASQTDGTGVVCREEDTQEFRADGLEGAIYGITPAFESAGVTRLDLNGRSGRVRAGGARIFYVMGGEGRFTVDGSTVEVQDGDAVHIRPDQVYDYEGELTLLCVCSPRADLREEEKAD